MSGMTIETIDCTFADEITGITDLRSYTVDLDADPNTRIAWTYAVRPPWYPNSGEAVSNPMYAPHSFAIDPSGIWSFEYALAAGPWRIFYALIQV